MSLRILIGDCREWLAQLEANSIDSCVTDPPYHLTSIVKRFGAENAAPAKVGKTGAYERASRGFMGQTWDGGDVAFDPATWEAVYRVLKPGAHLVAFSGTRTYHRMACAIEDAGFEIRDSLYWHYGSGFPKSHNVFKQLESKGLACTCHKSKLSHHHATDKNLHCLQQAVDALDEVSGGSEPDLQPDLQGCADRREGEGSARSQQDESDAGLFGLRQAKGNSAGVAQEGVETNLQPPVQRCAARAGLGEARSQGCSSSDAREPGQGGDARREESCMEGRCHAQEAEGELQGRSVCASARMGEADGAQGRLHHGAPHGDGADVRVSADQNRSGQPHRPQPVEQSPEQLGTLAHQRGSQAWGGWPVCDGCGKPIVPEGLGSALKPATEPICLARKPLSEGSIGANVLKHGTGALNIDGCRVPTNEQLREGSGIIPMRHDPSVPRGREGEASADKRYRNEGSTNFAALPGPRGGDPAGRWPANILHDGSEEVLAAFPDAPGQQQASRDDQRKQGNVYGTITSNGGRIHEPRNDSGSAARFFYAAKASSDERGEGNNHPTVKPIDLMRWLCRLITPHGGTVLDPFMGSGSTLIAADAEQFNAIGCELSEDYAAIAQRRIRDAAGLFAEVQTERLVGEAA